MAEFFEVKNGVLFPRLTPQRWEYLENFELQSDDLFVASHPKSGTTWTQQIVRLLRNRGQDDGKLLDRAMPWLDVLDSEYGSKNGYYPSFEKTMSHPRVFKSHLFYRMMPGGPPNTTQAKYIYVARNSKDVCVSFWHHTKRRQLQMPENENTWEKFAYNFFLGGHPRYGPWFDHVLEWWKHKDD